MSSEDNTSEIKKNILNEIKNAIDVPMMDVENISKLIFENYICDFGPTYHSCGNGFYYIYYKDFKGYIPDNDPELLSRIKELIKLGWTNANRKIRLDISSWKTKRQAIRNAIFNL
jgi:hypothetical protein